MENRQVIVDAIKKQGLVPLFSSSDKTTGLNIIQALYNSGIRLIEWTNRGANAFDDFIHIKKIIAAKMPGLFLGAGTIKTRQQAIDYIGAGADFIISPALAVEVAEVSHAHNFLWIPGCLTPSEILEAESLGASLVKIFPANVVGPKFIRSVKEIFPKMMFMPTGGIEADAAKLQQWFDAGVSAVGIGSTLISTKDVDQKSLFVLENNTRHLLEQIKEMKK